MDNVLRFTGRAPFLSQVVKSLREGRADVGVFVEVQETQGLDCQAFDHDELVFVIPHGHRLAGKEPLRFVDALDENWISFTEGAALLQRQRQAAHAAGRVLKLCMQLRHRLPSGGRRHGDCHAAGGRRPDRAELEASPASGCRCVGHPQPHRRHPLGPPRSKHQFVGGVHRPKFAKSEASREKTLMDTAPARSQTRRSPGLVQWRKQRMTYDILITGGNVVDGTGAAAFRADVALKDGRIAATARSARRPAEPLTRPGS